MSLYGTACSCHECADHSGHDPFIDDLPTDVGPDVKPTSDKDPMILWIEALRSGDYKQGRNQLRRDDKFCCLGVACEVYEKHVGGLDIHAMNDGVISGRVDYSYDGEYSGWPNVVRDWALGSLGLTTLDENELTAKLMNLNDGGHSFDEIADILESKLQLVETVRILEASQDTSLPCFDLGDMD